MRVLVSGSSGFVGTHMCAELKTRGYEVDGIDLRSDKGTGHTNYRMDAVDYFRRERLLIHRKYHYDLVVHCAYHVGGRAMIDGVPDVLSANVELDAALFRWALEARPGRILYFSSSAVYPTFLQEVDWPYSHQTLDRRLKEDQEVLPAQGRYIGIPDARYGWAKLNGEMLVKAARESGLEVAVVRPFSGYSYSQSLDYPFPSIVARARTGDLSVWGGPGQTRDWIHIDDVTKGALAVAESGTTDPVNLCTGISTEMGNLAQMIWSAATDNLPTPPEYAPNLHREPVYLTDKPTGVHYRVGNPARMLKYYTPKISLSQGIEEALSR